MLTIDLQCGDCLELLKSYIDQSIDCCITDPPYYKIKTDSWDNQWKTKEAYLDWLKLVLIEIRRVLKPNGSIILFINDKMLFEVGTIISEQFKIINNLIWVKPDAAGAEKGAKAKKINGFISKVEYAIFAEVPNSLGQQVKMHRTKAGISAGNLSAKINRSGKPTGLVGLWEAPYSKGGCLPNKDQYIEAIKICNDKLTTEEIIKDYELRKRIFNVDDTDYYDIFVCDYVRGKDKIHNCQKPEKLIEHYVKSITQPNFSILDPFMGWWEKLLKK
jgi:adenine-specific DNA-methyltransferase